MPDFTTQSQHELVPLNPRYLFLGPPAAPGDLGTLGPYRVVKLLGEGGMGYVFRAESDKLRRTVALKVMKPEEAVKPTAAEWFLREVRAVAGLRSDHVIVIYDADEANGVPFLAMEYLAGQTLGDWLKGRGGTAPAATAVRAVRHTLKGLAAVHSRGLIHRDIKPSNLWVEDPSGRVKVLDFGLARDMAGEGVTSSGVILGTPGYIAPEQAHGMPVDPRADLFSVGVVLYRMLTGANPFGKGSVLASLIAVGTEEPPPAVEVVPALPTDLSDFVARLMSKSTAGRPSSASAALAELLPIEKRIRTQQMGSKPAGKASGSKSVASAPTVRRSLAHAAARVKEMEGSGIEPSAEGQEYPPPVPSPARRKGRKSTRRATLLATVTAGAVLAVVVLPLENSADGYVSRTIGAKFARIKAGTFDMGSPSGEKGRLALEGENVPHKVRLTDDFFMGVTEVTRGAFRKFVDAEGYRTEAESDGAGGSGWDGSGFSKHPKYSWKGAGFEQADDHPVVNLTWHDAVRFAAWLSKQEGRTYRLPTEAEWEYACRGGATSRYHFGNDEEYLAKYGSVADKTGKAKFSDIATIAAEDGFAFTAPIGRFAANKHGLYDMHGNVWEWCSDWHANYPTVSQTNPAGPATGVARVFRGGKRHGTASDCRAASRGASPPSQRMNDLGFRLVVDPQ